MLKEDTKTQTAKNIFFMFYSFPSSHTALKHLMHKKNINYAKWIHVIIQIDL